MKQSYMKIKKQPIERLLLLSLKLIYLGYSAKVLS